MEKLNDTPTLIELFQYGGKKTYSKAADLLPYLLPGDKWKFSNNISYLRKIYSSECFRLLKSLEKDLNLDLRDIHTHIKPYPAMMLLKKLLDKLKLDFYTVIGL